MFILDDLTRYLTSTHRSSAIVIVSEDCSIAPTQQSQGTIGGMTDSDAVSIARQWIERWPPFDLEPEEDEPEEDEDGDDGDERRPFGISPIAVYVLHFLLECMSDDWTEDGAGVITHDDFPPSLRIWLLDDEFTRAMAKSCLNLSGRLASGRQELNTTCTADEINLAIASQLARDTGYELLVDNVVLDALLTAIGPIDIKSEIDLARDLLTQDADVDYLWNPALDGIENDDALLQAQGIAHLHPSKWFVQF